MKILITGATGFIGSHLTKALCNQGYQCRCLVRNLRKAREIFSNYRDIEFIVGDVRKPDSLRDIAKHIDIVFHLVALMGHDLPSEQAYKKFRSINVEGVRNILEECKKQKNIKRIVHLSSTAVYGILNQYIDENSDCNPFTPYQVSKYEGERLALSYYDTYKLPIIVLRPSMIYGPGFKGDFLTMARVAQKGIYPKFGFGKNLAPALYINDLIDVMISSIENGEAGNVYLITSNHSYTQMEICGVFEKFFGRRIFRIYIPTFLAKGAAIIQENILKTLHMKPIVTARNISSITHNRIFDISKARKELKFNPQIELRDGLAITLEWFEQEKLI